MRKSLVRLASATLAAVISSCNSTPHPTPPPPPDATQGQVEQVLLLRRAEWTGLTVRDVMDRLAQAVCMTDPGVVVQPETVAAAIRQSCWSGVVRLQHPVLGTFQGPKKSPPPSPQFEACVLGLPSAQPPQPDGSTQEPPTPPPQPAPARVRVRVEYSETWPPGSQSPNAPSEPGRPQFDQALASLKGAFELVTNPNDPDVDFILAVSVHAEPTAPADDPIQPCNGTATVHLYHSYPEILSLTPAVPAAFVRHADLSASATEAIQRVAAAAGDVAAKGLQEALGSSSVCVRIGGLSNAGEGALVLGSLQKGIGVRSATLIHQEADWVVIRVDIDTARRDELALAVQSALPGRHVEVSHQLRTVIQARVRVP